MTKPRPGIGCLKLAEPVEEHIRAGRSKYPSCWWAVYQHQWIEQPSVFGGMFYFMVGPGGRFPDQPPKDLRHEPGIVHPHLGPGELPKHIRKHFVYIGWVNDEYQIISPIPRF